MTLGEVPLIRGELKSFKLFGIVVHTCSGEVTATGDSPTAVLTAAITLKDEHLSLHVARGSRSCQMNVSSVSAINPAGNPVWTPVEDIISASPSPNKPNR